jgi:hypothetical protein
MPHEMLRELEKESKGKQMKIDRLFQKTEKKQLQEFSRDSVLHNAVAEFVVCDDQVRLVPYSCNCVALMRDMYLLL